MNTLTSQSPIDNLCQLLGGFKLSEPARPQMPSSITLSTHYQGSQMNGCILRVVKTPRARRHNPYWRQVEKLSSTHAASISLRDPRLQRPKNQLPSHVQTFLEEQQAKEEQTDEFQTLLKVFYEQLNYAGHEIPRMLQRPQNSEWLSQQQRLLQQLLPVVQLLSWSQWEEAIRLISQAIKTKQSLLKQEELNNHIAQQKLQQNRGPAGNAGTPFGFGSSLQVS